MVLSKKINNEKQSMLDFVRKQGEEAKSRDTIKRFQMTTKTKREAKL